MGSHRPGLPAQKKRTSSDVLFFCVWTKRRGNKGSSQNSFQATAARSPRSGHGLSCPVLPDGDRQPATRPPPLPPLPSFKIKVFGKDGGMQGGKGEPFSKKVSLPPCKQPAPAYTLKNRSRSALLTTEKEDMAMAVPAIMGESMGPPKTCSRPAATGRPSRL